MFSKIIIGVDGAAGGADALALARRLASDTTELVTVVVAVLEDRPSRGSNADYDRAVRDDAGAQITVADAAADTMQFEVVTAPSVGAGLHEAVSTLGGDLIVVGSSRRGVIGRILAGDDTHDTVRHAPCPVVVAPRDYVERDTPITQIGLGWDGFAQDQHALDVATGLGVDCRARVHALAVVKQVWPPATPGTPMRTVLEAEALGLREQARTMGLDATVVTGEVAEELERFAAEVDLLVVGSRSHGTIGRALLGSTSEHLARGCVRPLMVVPPVAVAV